MNDYLNIGPVPPEEDCAQVGSPDYYKRSTEECRRYIQKLREFVGPEPVGARLATKSFPHDFGTYHEVVCYYSDEEGADYCFRCEAEGPMRWDSEKD